MAGVVSTGAGFEQLCTRIPGWDFSAAQLWWRVVSQAEARTVS
jgi:hypothetical protein